MRKSLTKQEKWEQQAQAFYTLELHKGAPVYVNISHVSRSGMSRRAEFYLAIIERANGKEKARLIRVGFIVAKALGRQSSYDINKGGLLLQGCGMDMVFDTLYTLNCIYLRRKYSVLESIKEQPTSQLKHDDSQAVRNALFDADSWEAI